MGSIGVRPLQGFVGVRSALLTQSGFGVDQVLDDRLQLLRFSLQQHILRTFILQRRLQRCRFLLVQTQRVLERLDLQQRNTRVCG